MTLVRTFYSLLSKHEAVAAHSYCYIFFRISLFEAAFITKIKIIVCADYTIIVITCVNKNNVIISNNFERLQHLILLFKIPTGTRKNFFEIYSLVT